MMARVVDENAFVVTDSDVFHLLSQDLRNCAPSTNASRCSVLARRCDWSVRRTPIRSASSNGRRTEARSTSAGRDSGRRGMGHSRSVTLNPPTPVYTSAALRTDLEASSSSITSTSSVSTLMSLYTLVILFIQANSSSFLLLIIFL